MSETSGQLSLGIDAISPPQLGAGPAVIADWLTPDACQDPLSDIDAAEWSAQWERRVQHYGHRYDYGRRSVAADRQAAAPPLPVWVRQTAARLAPEGLMDQEAE